MLMFGMSYFNLRCYKCDISFGEISEMFDQDTCTTAEKALYKELSKFESTVLSLVQKANSNEEYDPSREEAEVKSQKMDEEISEAGDQDENGPYPLVRKSANFKHRMFGVSNIGNTCFFNATMQCLNASRPFVQHYVLSKDEYKKHDDVLGSSLELPRI